MKHSNIGKIHLKTAENMVKLQNPQKAQTAEERKSVNERISFQMGR